MRIYLYVIKHELFLAEKIYDVAVSITFWDIVVIKSW
jgi:hypothetical protein